MKTNKNKLLVILAALMFTFPLTACGTATTENSGAGKTGVNIPVETNGTATIEFTDFDLASDWDDTATNIILSDEDVAITEAGTYVLSGVLEDGQITVDVGSTAKVQLVLHGVDISCSDSAAIYIQNADKTVITLAEGTTNTLTDSSTSGANDMDGCIYSKDDLTINGTGALIVNGNWNNGIDCSNDLKIISGELTVSAVNNGIKGNDSVSIKGGNIIVNSQDDGVKSDGNDDSTQGCFYMEGGALHISAGDDGIRALTDVTVTAGKITVSAKDKEINCDGTTHIADGCLISQ